MSEDEYTTRLMMLERRYAAMEQRVSTLEGKRPGRKAKPVIVSEEHVCGVEPGRDSATCPDASLYRRHQKCKGDRCVQIADEYYNARRKRDGS
jgi:hypothetical protein